MRGNTRERAVTGKEQSTKMTKRTLRNRLITAGAIMGTAGLILAGGLPAVAEESLEAPWPPNGIIFGDEAPEETVPEETVPEDTAPEDEVPEASPGTDDATAVDDATTDDEAADEQDADPTSITPTVEVSGWPEGHVFYAGETVTLNVHVDAGVVGAPSLEGMVAGLGYGGEPLAFAELDAEGNAFVSVRPLITGTLHFTPFFVGEGAYNSATGVGGDVEVDSVPTETMIWIDWMDDDGTLIGYGGETLQANAYIEPFCVDEEDDAATDACYATYGVPTGSLAVMRDGETIGEAVVEGPATDAAFADVNADLSEGARAEWTFASFSVPPILLGSPNSFEVTAGFASDNWFTAEVAGPFTVEVEAFQTDLELYIDHAWSDESPVPINASEVLLTAYFQHGDRTGAAPSGTVEFFANDTSIGEVPVGEDADGVDFLWNPIEGGEYVLRAVFTPDTLNHLGSETPEYPVMVIIPPVPNPTPVDPDPADNTPTEDPKTDNQGADTSTSPSALAKTGGSSIEIAGFAGIGLLLAGAAALILAGRKRA